jgi:hypothetical protein
MNDVKDSQLTNQARPKRANYRGWKNHPRQILKSQKKKSRIISACKIASQLSKGSQTQ